MSFEDGSAVEEGTILGQLARTSGDALGCGGVWDNPHLHFEIYDFRPAENEWDGIPTTAYSLGGWAQDPDDAGRDGAIEHQEFGRRQQLEFIVSTDMPVG